MPKQMGFEMARAEGWRRSSYRPAWWAVLPMIAAAVLVGLPTPAAQGALSFPCGGKRPLRPGGGFYLCTFDDEFNGTTVDGKKWYPITTAATGFHSGPECFMLSTNNISEGDGVLRLTARKEAAPFTCKTPTGGYTTQYTSGALNTLGRFSQTYGRYEIRAKFPAATVAGIQSSLWMLPVSNTYGPWPTNGEIDIAEQYSLYPDRAIPYVHYSPAGGYDPNATNNFCKITPNQFHTFVLQWTTSAILISYDGAICVYDTWNPAPPLVKPAPFDQPFLIVLSQLLGIDANAVTDATELPATTQIDYVRVWS
jgi:beta-glucanase (GH16 family)